MGTWGVILLIGGALAVGLLADRVIDGAVDRDWPLCALAAGIGAYVGSEYLGPLSNWGPAADGLRIVPALLGAFTIGVVIDAVLGRLLHARRSA
ncbi:MAG TPA: hypothetical protein VFN57_13050 [Thermomicrobiaceae bacterium]|nr:hypothetical protein [Thermomicrobiaceae bacterium]